MSAVLFSITAILFFLGGALGDSPAFYGFAAAFLALAAAEALEKRSDAGRQEGDMDQIILYGSHYGSTKQYAEQLSRRTGIPAIPYQDRPALSGVGTVVYLGGLYAGGVVGLSKTMRGLSLGEENQRLILVTVGLADPREPENRDTVCAALRRQLSPALFQKASIYHLRGGIDYSRLSFAHRTVMKLLYQALRRKSPETLTAEDRALMETYGKQVSFVNFDTLEPVIREMQG